MPEISVLMSVYNGAEYIADSIESILNQTYSDFEFIIVNDGSTDNTLEIIKSYQDKRIRLFNFTENRGIGSALKFGLTKVQGKYLAKADSDDIHLPERLAKQKAFLDTHSDISLVKALIEYFPHNEVVRASHRYNYYKSIIENEKNSIISPEQINEKLYWYCCIPHTTVMARTDVIKKIGYEEMRICEDYYLFYQMNKQGYKMVAIDEVLVKMRISTSSVMASTESINFGRVMYSIKKEEISNLFKNQSNVYIWGTGSLGHNVADILYEKGHEFSGFIDSDKKKHGTKIGEKTVYAPAILDCKGRNKIIVASQPGKNEIVKNLKEWGYRHLEDFLVYY